MPKTLDRARTLLLAACGLGLACLPARAETVLRVVPQADLRVLDPHVTAATVTRIFGLMIYDQLYSFDEAMRPHPQMVGDTRVSADKLTYELTLRDGLKFSNGQPVTSADVIASITRAAKQDPLLQLMMKRQSRFEAVDARTVRLVFPKPFAYVESALAAPGAMIMRAEDLAAAGDKPATTTIGSGPFRFVASGYTPGARITFDRNPDYVPRAEPANGNAGGKRVLVDKVEWVIIPDLQTRVSALIKGEVDLLDQLPHDGLQSLKGRADIVVEQSSPLGNMAFMRVNTLQPPFNDVRARQALALLINQKDYLAAAFTTDSTWWQECFSFFGCATPNGTEAGSEPYRKPDPARAKQLLAEAGYKGEKIVVLSSQEIPLIGALAEVTGDALRSIGANVDMQTSDWGTLVVRRARKDAPDKGGWSIFQSGIDVAVLAEPATNILVDARCDGNNYVGWPCSDKLEAMRTDVIDTPDAAKYEAYSRALWAELPTLLLGQYRQPIAYRKALSGLQHGLTLSFWNVSKK
ncbi:ABC transporter substrate-binding protein [Limobrevibacterium gyesilva]|uniref:ABC transporter substrate-binding protein n=1 Tax=Limobrevibacterium gyesilva TaxID=2991712 RepID=A0AA41YQB8_9PROT|nr:ABC transporter substrate-binding protein [Limobrevibacterium gyesilva]MCW3474520.1 ABC transporter substrate-binding protein [Limobrevibacterium gyesilva]